MEEELRNLAVDTVRSNRNTCGEMDLANQTVDGANSLRNDSPNRNASAFAADVIETESRKNSGIILLSGVLLVGLLAAAVSSPAYFVEFVILRSSAVPADLRCNPYLNTSALFLRIKDQQILHQEEALQLLEEALQHDGNFTAIALAGPAGVGKSLWATALQQHFPWPENVHSYDWSTAVEDEVEKFHIVRMFLENLSDCGRNLLIFDGLRPCDRELVTIVNKIIRHGEGYKLFNDKRVIVIYIFRLDPNEGNDELYKFQFEMLQYLRDTKTINFKSFGQKELEGCIRREARVANLTLSVEDFDNIMAAVDVKHEGCNRIRSNVLKYGVPRS